MNFKKAINIVINEAEYRLLDHGSIEVFEACRVVEQFVNYLPDDFTNDRTPNMKKKAYTDFYNDTEKMKDFRNLTKDDFLQSYSYLHETEYNLTRIKCRENKDES